MKAAAQQQRDALGLNADKAVIDACKAFKEAGFKPKMVFRNLPPSHLYEKVRIHQCSDGKPWLCDSYYETRDCAKSTLRHPAAASIVAPVCCCDTTSKGRIDGSAGALMELNNWGDTTQQP